MTQCGAVPDSAIVVPRAGRCDWVLRELRFRLFLRRDPGGCEPSGVERIAFVRLAGWLGDEWQDGGLGASVGLKPVAPAAGVNSRAELALFISAAEAAVVDPEDLCRLLTQQADIPRDSVVVWPFQGYPARLVMALVSARELGFGGLEAEIIEVLRSGAMVEVAPTQTEDIMVAARRWSATLSEQTGVKISI